MMRLVFIVVRCYALRMQSYGKVLDCAQFLGQKVNERCCRTWFWRGFVISQLNIVHADDIPKEAYADELAMAGAVAEEQERDEQ